MPFQKKEFSADLCVIGGGLAGTIAALTAARKGAKVVLIQDRPMLGGNSSSEIRMWVRGARGYCNRESGILSEFEEENIYRNPTLAHPLWDGVLFGKIKENENITLLLNASVMDAAYENGQIASVTAWQLTTYTFLTVRARIFADCSGDSVLSYLTDAACRLGREGHDEYGETIGPEKTDRMTMGMSILLQAREVDHPVTFIPPDWANVYETDRDFAIRPAEDEKFALTRDHKICTEGTNLWWIELGGDTGDPTAFAEETRDELIRIAYGIWDHIKNRGDHGCENWELEWVGFLPGKRESGRYIGDYVLTQNDIESDRDFPDAVAYGGWPLDDHDPRGFRANSPHDFASRSIPTTSPYQIPYRCLYSANVENLMFAGRNISVTHAALSSTRVMGTCSLLGQAVGNAAALCVRYHCLPRELTGARIEELRRAQLDDGIMIPGTVRKMSALTLSAEVNLSDEERAVLFDGYDRPRKTGDRHFVTLAKGGTLSFTFPERAKVGVLRMMFDPDWSRKSVSAHPRIADFAQRLNRGLDFKPANVAATLVRSFRVLVDGKEVFAETNNYHSLVRIPIESEAKNVTVEFTETRGSEEVRVFACDFI